MQLEILGSIVLLITQQIKNLISIIQTMQASLNSYGKNDLGSWNNYESQMIPNPYGNNSLTSPSLEKQIAAGGRTC